VCALVSLSESSSSCATPSNSPGRTRGKAGTHEDDRGGCDPEGGFAQVYVLGSHLWCVGRSWRRKRRFRVSRPSSSTFAAVRLEPGWGDGECVVGACTGTSGPSPVRPLPPCFPPSTSSNYAFSRFTGQPARCNDTRAVRRVFCTFCWPVKLLLDLHLLFQRYLPRNRIPSASPTTLQLPIAL
jgi:hypothetical protein